MKKLILLSVTFLITLISCSRDALNYDKCLEEVKREFPKAKIYNAIGFSKYKFVVVDSINLYLIETMNISDAKISYIYYLKLQ
jgi:hypothetical protein